MRTPALLFLLAALGNMQVHAQGDIENVIVETYYVSDANDATDTIGGTLAEGSRTYRVFLDLGEGRSLRAVYGNTDHPLRITSTADFFNNLDRGKLFGHEVTSGALDENTVALDSWLSMGAASNQKLGVLKQEDPDGSIVGGTHNDGGSGQVPGGLLANAHPDAGIPLTEQDGLVPVGAGSSLPPSFVPPAGPELEHVFGDSTLASAFISHDVRFSCSTPGTVGPTADNRILIAQLTTAGELSFQLNIEVQRADGTVLKYVADDTLLQPDETPSGFLTYPPQCGCTDPNYLEYDGTAGCDDGSCHTPIVFGCMDPAACNYDTEANFHVPQLCCYGPDSCNGLDIARVCPNAGIDDVTNDTRASEVFPNPAHDRLFLRTHAALPVRTLVRVHDLAGRTVLVADLGVVPVDATPAIDLAHLSPGAYVVCVSDGRAQAAVRLIKD